MNGKPIGGSSRARSTMSLSMRPQRRLLSSAITRSQSFAGVNSSDKCFSRNFPAFSTPTVSRKSGSRITRMFSMSHKSPPPKVPQPDRVDEVYEALKKGLGAYLEVHQVELDKLSTQIRESKRNSRLGFLYDLDKQVKSIERFIRRLEFHSSKIDELYESYCIQRRLRDGANNMVKAYTASPGSKEARESLAEAGKGYKEYTENMCTLESELESQLGEFHVRMKGLAGFARLCAGDQYEIFMKYGRQRWKLKGRIEVNSKQVWDSEEMVFLPLITEFLSIKVTELKSLANHVVVGSVSCETKDLFAALPQVVAVDINDLGTIKLSLEVNWNPFDKDDQPSAASTVNKSSSVNKRLSTYNQSPPDTPSLREQAFYNMLRRQDDLENGAAWSISSESSDDSSSPQLSSAVRHSQKAIVQPEVQATPPAIEIAFTQREETLATGTELPSQEGQEEMLRRQERSELAKEVIANGHVPYSRTLSHISEVSIDAAILDSREVKAMDTPACAQPVDGTTPEVAEVSQELHFLEILPSTVEPQMPQETDSNLTALDSKTETQKILENSQTLSTEPEAHSIASKLEVSELIEPEGATLERNQDKEGTASPVIPLVLDPLSEGTLTAPVVDFAHVVPPLAVLKVRPVDTGLEEAINSLNSSLDDYRGQFPELQTLEREVKHLEEILLKQGVFRSRASSISLTVEHALESFDFLNSTSDIEESECSEEEGGQGERNGSSTRPGALAAAAGEAVAEDAGVCSGSEGSSDPLSTGNEFLDRALVIHLINCNKLLLRLGTFGPLRCREMYALDKLMKEAQVMEIVCRLMEERSGMGNTAEEVVQFSTHKEGILVTWNHCIEPPNVYSTSVERFLQGFSSQHATRINERQQGLAELVFVRLAEELLDRKLPKRLRGGPGEQLTLFQYWSHFESLSISALDTYIMELAEEVIFIENLNADDQDVVLKALKRVPDSRVQKEGLKTLSLLLTNGNSKVIAAVASLLRSFSESPKFRERALVCFLEQLEDEEPSMRISGCVALGCIKAKESIDQLVYLCQTDKEEVRDAAKHSLMIFDPETTAVFLLATRRHEFNYKGSDGQWMPLSNMF
ncbi:rho family-interacting cell polarization regulator 1 isoform X4 [Rhinatrema bivittatum]|uniref:rho family-interacting cell polarization regulator 1 isoform X4 n=1 Tax=Rhinatrema bivittatum TaxID=194408 RepID=UPI00112915C5|nr:rho family-interacting cell polarization regulator 1 isoform X4 [Rhinatrema bivittatum]